MSHVDHASNVHIKNSRPVAGNKIRERKPESTGPDRSSMNQMVNASVGFQSRLQCIGHSITIYDVDTNAMASTGRLHDVKYGR